MGACLPLIQVCKLDAACLALALATSLSFSFFFSLSFSSFLSFSFVALSSSALARLMASVCLASFCLTSSCMASIPFPPPLVAGTGAAAAAFVAAGIVRPVTGTEVGGAAASTLPVWAEALARSSATM